MLQQLPDGVATARCAYEELTSPPAPHKSLLVSLDEMQPSAQRERVPRLMSQLNAGLAEVGEEVCGEKPFEYRGETIGEEETKPIGQILHKIHEKANPQAPDFPADVYGSHAAAGRLQLNDIAVNSLEQEMRRGDTLEFFGATRSKGCILKAIAESLELNGSSTSGTEIASNLASWLAEESRPDYVFCGMKLRDLINWDRLPPSMDRGWEGLIAHINESSQYLPDTGADWLLLVATAHVYGPVIVFHAGAARAVRFVAADGADGRGYRDSAHLPAASESWIRLGLLPGGYFVTCRSKLLTAEVMLDVLDTMEAAMREKLPIEIQDGYILLAPSKTGKSTITNAMYGHTLFGAARRQETGRKKKVEPELGVLPPGPVQGSKIGVGRVSETLFVSVCGAQWPKSPNYHPPSFAYHVCIRLVSQRSRMMARR